MAVRSPEPVVPPSPALGRPSSLKGAFMDKPVLASIKPDDSAIDYIGRWDSSKTARWAGSSLRFSFNGPLLFLVPGPNTISTEYPTIGWQIAGSFTTYTATARPSTAIRLWPPEGDAHDTPVSPKFSGEDNGDLPTLRQSQNGVANAPDTPTRAQNVPTTSATDGAVPRIIEITLIDWGSIFQVGSLQTIAGYWVEPAYPSGIADLPTMVFIGDSITSGFVSSPTEASTPGGYCGFLDAYPAHLRNLLSPGVRVSAVAFPGIKLVDSAYIEGMESKWFKKGPLGRGNDDGTDDWDFGDRDNEAGPTHIVVSIGTNDTADTKTFLATFENFLDLLKETHGRRTGDILVLPPFGARDSAVSDRKGKEPVTYESGRYAEIKEMVKRVSERWQAESNDPLSGGDFPATPVFELTKLQLEEVTKHSGLSSSPSRHSLSTKVANAIASQPSTPLQTTFSPAASTTAQSSGLPSMASLQSIASIASMRPSLVVRPSSIAAVSPAAKGTRARLHFVDTKGWLDAHEDTFDDVHPTRSGAVKIARRFREWLSANGFLAE